MRDRARAQNSAGNRPFVAASIAFILPSFGRLVGDLVGALDAAPTPRSVALDVLTPAKRLDPSR
jgi:hypothetical protein